jgi:hypothetical protein
LVCVLLVLPAAGSALSPAVFFLGDAPTYEGLGHILVHQLSVRASLRPSSAAGSAVLSVVFFISEYPPAGEAPDHNFSNQLSLRASLVL